MIVYLRGVHSQSFFLSFSLSNVEDFEGQKTCFWNPLSELFVFIKEIFF
jgi:hypothetical protein